MLTTPRSASWPTAIGLPFSSGLSRCSTAQNKTTETVEIANLTELKEFLNDLIKKHDKRVEANAKKKEAKAANEEKLIQLKELVESAAEYDMSFDDVLEAVSKSFREKKNAKIREQIAALQAQIED